MTETHDEQDKSSSIDLSDPVVIARFEPYLRVLARTQMRRAYQAKVGSSDMVQQVMLQAVQAYDGFRGSTEAELRGWLRKILAHHLYHLDRDMHREKRDIRKEQRIAQNLEKSSLRLQNLLPGDEPSPSHHVAVAEHLLRLSEAIEQLPELQGEAIRLHHLEGLKLSEVAERLGKSPGAVAGLMHRGMKTLRQQMPQHE